MTNYPLELRHWTRRLQRAMQTIARRDLASLGHDVTRFVVWHRLQALAEEQERLGAINRVASWQSLYNHPVWDLGATGNPHLNGIFSRRYEQSRVDDYVHAQFIEDANSYAERYSADDYFTRLISEAISKTSLGGRAHQRLAIVDIGSGAGNSIFPLLSLFPNALVVASDLSIEMLVLLKETLVRRQLEQNCVILQLNAEELDFVPASLDLVLGAAVLHHLFSPEQTLQRCADILKPGGYAIFFEPFELGYGMLRMMFDAILADPRAGELSPRAHEILTAIRYDVDVRRGVDKSAPIFRRIDDKWLFNQQFFRDAASRYGFSKCTIYQLHQPQNLWRNQTLTLFRLSGARDEDMLPPWAWDIINAYDEHFSDHAKQELIIEGCVILKK